MEKHITTPITQKITKDLKSGDYVYITGEMYVARDAAHKRMIEALDRKEELPIDIKDSTIYYMGPSPARDGRPIGSAGPTTATRMDKYAPRLLDLGEKAMIGKGKRSKEVIDAVIRNKAVYFAAVGGAGALLSKCIKSSEVICYDDLGAEAIRKIYVEDFPVIVVIDSEGNNLYETSIKEFKKYKILLTKQRKFYRINNASRKCVKHLNNLCKDFGEVLKWPKRCPAKGIGRETGARVQIPPSPLYLLHKII